MDAQIKKIAAGVFIGLLAFYALLNAGAIWDSIQGQLTGWDENARKEYQFQLELNRKLADGVAADKRELARIQDQYGELPIRNDLTSTRPIELGKGLFITVPYKAQGKIYLHTDGMQIVEVDMPLTSLEFQQFFHSHLPRDGWIPEDGRPCWSNQSTRACLKYYGGSVKFELTQR